MVTKKLVLTFLDEKEKKVKLSINDIKETITTVQVNAIAAAIIDKKVIKSLFLIKSLESAKVVETNTDSII